MQLRKNLLKKQIQKLKKDDKNTLFSIATVLSNVSNAQPVKKPTDEMIKLAEYAKHHIPETNEKVFFYYIFQIRKIFNIFGQKK